VVGSLDIVLYGQQKRLSLFGLRRKGKGTAERFGYVHLRTVNQNVSTGYVRLLTPVAGERFSVEVAVKNKVNERYFGRLFKAIRERRAVDDANAALLVFVNTVGTVVRIAERCVAVFYGGLRTERRETASEVRQEAIVCHQCLLKLVKV